MKVTIRNHRACDYDNEMVLMIIMILMFFVNLLVMLLQANGNIFLVNHGKLYII